MTDSHASLKITSLFEQVSRVESASWSPEPGFDAVLEENWLFKLRRERFRSRATGQSHDYYVIHLADAVNVIAVTPERELVMVSQFRAGSRADSLETPGGLLNPGEDPRAAGARELLEETGYAGDRPEIISTVWSNPSLLGSKITTILIENARLVAGTAFDDHEELALVLVPRSEIVGLIQSGRIDHALVVQGLLSWIMSRTEK
jgi:8-oxo-dGTP pyrophosphatase MutT (NUDIX family)